MILIHICCADCGLKLVNAIKIELNILESEIILYFYNPNIHPESEWHVRKNAVKKAFENTKINLHTVTWEPNDYFEELKKRQSKNKPFDIWQKKYRCPICWELRLKKTYEYAVNNNFKYISSTLFSSIYHDANLIRNIIQKFENKYKIKAIIPESIDHCLNTGGFYKQNYEGCIFSLIEKYQNKYLSR